MGKRFVYSTVTAKPISFPLPVLWDLIALVFLFICVIHGCELVGVNLAYFNFDSYDFHPSETHRKDNTVVRWLLLSDETASCTRR